MTARAEHGRGETRLHVGGELFLPLRAHHRFDRRRLDRAHADDGLDQELLARRAPVELLVDQIAQRRPHQEADQHVDRQADQHDQGEARRIGEHHREEDEGEDEVDRRKQPLPGQEGADGLQLPHPGDRLSGRARLEIADRQPQEMGEQPLAEFDVDAVGGVRQRVGAQVLQRDVEQADDHEAGDHHEQGLVALVRQHLVDDHLENQRRRQGEDLDEQRRRQHMPERSAVAPEGRQEPAHPEGLRVDAGAADPAGDQKRLPPALARKLLERDLHHRMADRIDQPAKARRDAPGVDVKRAALQPNDRRGRHFLHPLRTRAGHQPRPQADLLGGANEIEFVGLPHSPAPVRAEARSDRRQCGNTRRCRTTLVDLRRSGLRPRTGGLPVSSRPAVTCCFAPPSTGQALATEDLRVLARTLPPAPRKPLHYEARGLKDSSAAIDKFTS